MGSICASNALRPPSTSSKWPSTRPMQWARGAPSAIWEFWKLGISWNPIFGEQTWRKTDKNGKDGLKRHKDHKGLHKRHRFKPVGATWTDSPGPISALAPVSPSSSSETGTWRSNRFSTLTWYDMVRCHAAFWKCQVDTSCHAAIYALACDHVLPARAPSAQPSKPQHHPSLPQRFCVVPLPFLGAKGCQAPCEAHCEAPGLTAWATARDSYTAGPY